MRQEEPGREENMKCEKKSREGKLERRGGDDNIMGSSY